MKAMTQRRSVVPVSQSTPSTSLMLICTKVTPCASVVFCCVLPTRQHRRYLAAQRPTPVTQDALVHNRGGAGLEVSLLIAPAEANVGHLERRLCGHEHSGRLAHAYASSCGSS